MRQLSDAQTKLCIEAAQTQRQTRTEEKRSVESAQAERQTRTEEKRGVSPAGSPVSPGGPQILE